MFPQDESATLPTPARPRSCPPPTKISSNMTAAPMNSSQDITSIRDKNVERTAGSPIIPQLALHEPCSVIIENVDSTSLYESPADEVLITRGDSTRSESRREGPRKEEATAQNEKVHCVRIDEERTGWAKLSDLIHHKDKDRVEDVKEDIDTLLVFAGLFSAVITAFIIESYKDLQQQPEDTTNQILLQMSAQLASLTVSGSLINSTVPAFTPPPFNSPKYTVLVNTLWFLSLIIALITASLGILVKQWLHELLAYGTHDPQKRLKLRFYREAGLERWKVFEIASSLPLLLQVSLLLFFIGLSVFLHQLNIVVGWSITGVIIIWLTGFLFTILAPASSAQCPYKTPTLKALFRWARQAPQTVLRTGIIKMTTLMNPLVQRQRHARERWPYCLRQWFVCWVSKREALEEEILCEDKLLDFSTLLCSCNVLQGENVRETLIHCSKDFDIRDVIEQFQIFRNEQSPLKRGLIPGTQIYEEVTEEAREVLSDILGGSQSLIRDVGEGCYPFIFQELHLNLTIALSESYVPGQNHPIPFTSLPMFIKLIQGGPMPAAFTILTMYSIQLRTMKEHPDRWEYLFGYLHDTDLRLHNIVRLLGDSYISNLLETTKTVIRILWDQRCPEDNSQNIHLVECITKCCERSGLDFPPDPIALTFVFSMILHGLTPRSVVQKHRDHIIEVVHELVELIIDLDGSTWSLFRQECVKWTCRHLRWNGLVDNRFRARLQTLVRTWDTNWRI